MNVKISGAEAELMIQAQFNEIQRLRKQVVSSTDRQNEAVKLLRSLRETIGLFLDDQEGGV